MSHVRQVYNHGVLTPKALQYSIYAGAHAYSNKRVLEKVNTTPLNQFCGIVIKKNSPFEPLDDFKLPEHPKTESIYEKYKVLNEQTEKRERIARETHFKYWIKNLDDQDKEKILGGGWKIMPDDVLMAALTEHHELLVYPAEKNKEDQHVG